jgi:hypothetical protein
MILINVRSLTTRRRLSTEPRSDTTPNEDVDGGHYKRSRMREFEHPVTIL